MDQEEEDEVVRELDVYVTDKLDIFLLQLPLKPCYMDPPEIISAKFKPENRKLEVEGNSTIPSLGSSKLAKMSNLAVGVIRNNAMHITPVQDVLQLRPLFNNLQVNEEEVGTIDVDEEEKVVPAAKVANKPVMQQVQVKRRDAERSQTFKRKSYAAEKAKQDNEAWQTLSVHGIDSTGSQTIFEELYYHNNNSSSSS